jgi:hypothetical protein
MFMATNNANSIVGAAHHWAMKSTNNGTFKLESRLAKLESLTKK